MNEEQLIVRKNAFSRKGLVDRKLVFEMKMFCQTCQIEMSKKHITNDFAKAEICRRLLLGHVTLVTGPGGPSTTLGRPPGAPKGANGRPNGTPGVSK